jgi:hypothetical protein
VDAAAAALEDNDVKEEDALDRAARASARDTVDVDMSVWLSLDKVGTVTNSGGKNGQRGEKLVSSRQVFWPSTSMWNANGMEAAIREAVIPSAR